MVRSAKDTKEREEYEGREGGPGEFIATEAAMLTVGEGNHCEPAESRYEQHFHAVDIETLEPLPQPPEPMRANGLYIVPMQGMHVRLMTGTLHGYRLGHPIWQVIRQAIEVTEDGEGRILQEVLGDGLTFEVAAQLMKESKTWQ